MTLNQPELFSIVAARSRFTPAHITGELHGAGAAAAHSLAVAVNGRIVAVMRSIPRPGSNSRFSAIAPEASFRNGVNRVQILEISGGGTQPALASLGATRPVHSRFSLGHGRISFLGHRPIRIDRRSVEGLIEHTSNVGQDVRFDGWALRTKDRRPVDRILAFVGDQLAVADKPHETRADVGRYFKTAPGRLGFSFSLRGELAKQAGVHVFAVAGGVASRLPYACAPAAKQVIGC
jgi:hypothetical protein